MTSPGIDEAAVTAWYQANLEGTAPLRFERLAGGHSNLTYRVTDGAGVVTVLRRPPEGELLPSAHDMGREWKAISALGPTPVPVAPALGFCADPTVTGARFYVMGFVAGAVLHAEDDVLALLDPALRRPCSRSLAEVLAALHAVDVDAVGLSDLGKPENYVARQLRRWYGQYQSSRGSTPLVDTLHDRLSAAIPAEQRVTVVHGDYRLGNTITAADGSVAAVLDWEICTLGDPLADLGYLLATWTEAGDPVTIASSPAASPGFASRFEMAGFYAAQSDLDLSDLPFYVAFNYWKVACINQGVWARYDQGQTSSEGVDVASIRASVDRLAELSLAALDAG